MGHYTTLKAFFQILELCYINQFISFKVLTLRIMSHKYQKLLCQLGIGLPGQNGKYQKEFFSPNDLIVFNQKRNPHFNSRLLVYMQRMLYMRQNNGFCGKKNTQREGEGESFVLGIHLFIFVSIFPIEKEELIHHLPHCICSSLILH